MKAEEFIGWKSDDGLLTVTGISHYLKSVAIFNVHCEICSKDTELFPNGFFTSKSSLVNKKCKPCACSGNYKWSEEQWLIRAKRYCHADVNVIDYAEPFRGKATLINRKCKSHGHLSTIRLEHFYKPCSICSSTKYLDNDVFHRASAKCLEHGYLPLGFVNGYKNSFSYFSYSCPKHGNKNVRFTNLMQGNKCTDCTKEQTGLYGYYKDRRLENDHLYVLNFDNQFIKVGRAFNVSNRIVSLRQSSGIHNIFEILILNGSHDYVYRLEQSLLEFLRSYHLSYETDFTTESFSNESIDYINWFLLNES